MFVWYLLFSFAKQVLKLVLCRLNEQLKLNGNKNWFFLAGIVYFNTSVGEKNSTAERG